MADGNMDQFYTDDILGQGGFSGWFWGLRKSPIINIIDILIFLFPVTRTLKFMLVNYAGFTSIVIGVIFFIIVDTVWRFGQLQYPSLRNQNKLDVNREL